MSAPTCPQCGDKFPGRIGEPCKACGERLMTPELMRSEMVARMNTQVPETWNRVVNAHLQHMIDRVPRMPSKTRRKAKHGRPVRV